MSAKVVGLVFCFASFFALAVSVGIPFWSYASSGSLSVYSGLWQFCNSTSSVTSCKFNEFGVIVRWDVVRGLEAAACALGLVGTILAFLAVCLHKSSIMYVAAAVLEGFAAGFAIAGFINYAELTRSGLKNAHAGFYLNIIGWVGLCIGGIILMCVRRSVDQDSPQSGKVLQSHGHQQPTQYQGRRCCYYEQPVYHKDVSIPMQRK